MSADNHGTHALRPKVTVIIPFYQKSPGILARALVSVFAQDDAAELSVVVVDDASPVTAESEVALLPARHAARVRVIHQANAGPGAARNRALNALPPDVEYVAYLDSDDWWLPGHLARAVAALSAGNDFYFSNYRDIGCAEPGFLVRGHLDAERHPPLPGVPDVRCFEGDLRDDVLVACPVETSTVVFRRSTFAGLRFRREFRHAYEDLMYWFEMVAVSPRIVFSPVVGTQYGEGVNVYRSAEPNSDADLRLLVGSTLFGAGVRRTYRLTPTQRAAVEGRLSRNRLALSYQLLYRTRRGLRYPLAEVIAYLRADPVSWLLLPIASLRQTFRWLMRRGLEP